MVCSTPLTAEVVDPGPLLEKTIKSSVATAKANERSIGRGASFAKTRAHPMLLRLQIDNKVSWATHDDHENPIGQTCEHGTKLLEQPMAPNKISSSSDTPAAMSSLRKTLGRPKYCPIEGSTTS
jgi:hypothetical protein